jgi:hypothetical protein
VHDSSACAVGAVSNPTALIAVAALHMIFDVDFDIPVFSIPLWGSEFMN